MNPEMLNPLCIEFISQNTIWSVALTGHWFILYFIVHLPRPLPTLSFIYSSVTVQPLPLRAVLNLLTFQQPLALQEWDQQGLRPYRDTAVQQSHVKNLQHKPSAIQSTLTQAG